jgi:hypothetical protein
MTALSKDEVRRVLADLTGHKAPLDTAVPEASLALLASGGSGLGYSQLNELLLILGYDRITTSFYQFLVNGEREYEVGSTIQSLDQLVDGITRFRKIALLLYGNVKFAFKTLSRDTITLQQELGRLIPIDTREFQLRHDPVLPIQPIASNETYFLGYIIEAALKSRLEADPADKDAIAAEQTRLRIVEQGKRNHVAYLTSDHLDVYVATSMRQRHEFMAVGRLASEIFEQPELSRLKLRWFDPTQAYCKDRVDKGLAEALMLRRASCTIYLAQEIDTLGKDSELASTLAQGKTVIAFVPEGDHTFLSQLLADLRIAYPDKSERELLLEQLRIYQADAAWNDPTVRAWLDPATQMDMDAARARLQEQIAKHYNSRAKTLKESHPLGIQVNLATGVANGVLVVRNVHDCARLVKAIVTRTLDFDLTNEVGFLALRECISGSVYRVSTHDMMLTNSFWNFYLEPQE